MQQPSRIKGPLILVVLNLYFVANGLQGMWDLVSLAEMADVFFRLLLFSIPAVLVALAMYKQKEKIWVMAFFLDVYFLFCRSMFTPLRAHITHLVFFLVSGIIFLLLYYVLRQSSTTSAARFGRFLLVLFTILILVDLFIIQKPKDPFMVPVKQELTPWKGEKKPDIYVLLFDEYQGNRGLKERFNFSNHALHEYLQHKGFTVATLPKSPYNTTFYAVLSMFSMDTLQLTDLPHHLTERGIVKATHLMSARNNTISYLTENGYSVTANALFSIDGKKPTGPHLTTANWTQLQILRTLYGWCFDDLFTHIPSNRIQKILHSLCARYQAYNKSVEQKTFESIGKGMQPKFVYSHFLLPHLPVMLNAEGKEFPFADAVNELNDFRPSVLTTYPQQVAYTNKLIERLVDTISNKDPDAVIIIVSDHGCRNVTGFTDDVFNIQWAMKIPGKSIATDEKDLHLVNTFRILFNEIAGQQQSMISTVPQIID